MLTTLLAVLLMIVGLLQPVEPAPVAKAAPRAQSMEWTLDGVKRTALVYIPEGAKATTTPVIFAFHGHGGSARNAASKFNFERHWPEAICVYMEGLPTPGKFDQAGERRGWQKSAGDQNDRDLKFFDEVLVTLKSAWNVDTARVFATGHSNGGGFTYLLWSERPNVLAAIAPSAAGSRSLRSTKPKPVMHIAGRKDRTVHFESQSRTIDRVKAINACDKEGTAWARDCTIYPSKKGTPVVTLIHPGDHAYPNEAPALIARFFRETAHAITSPPRAEPGG